MEHILCNHHRLVSMFAVWLKGVSSGFVRNFTHVRYYCANLVRQMFNTPGTNMDNIRLGKYGSNICTSILTYLYLICLFELVYLFYLIELLLHISHIGVLVMGCTLKFSHLHMSRNHWSPWFMKDNSLSWLLFHEPKHTVTNAWSVHSEKCHKLSAAWSTPLSSYQFPTKNSPRFPKHQLLSVRSASSLAAIAGSGLILPTTHHLRVWVTLSSLTLHFGAAHVHSVTVQRLYGWLRHGMYRTRKFHGFIWGELVFTFSVL